MQTYKIMGWFFIFHIDTEKADVEPTSSELVLPAFFDSLIYFFFFKQEASKSLSDHSMENDWMQMSCLSTLTKSQ